MMITIMIMTSVYLLNYLLGEVPPIAKGLDIGD